MTDAPHPALLPTGMHDLLPPEAEIEAQVVAQLMTTLAAHGYERVKPPLVEFEDTLFSGAGAAMATATFRMMDPASHRMIGVRADMTPQIARIAATRLGDAPRPLRLSYAGQVLRVTGSEIRPERQIGQVGAELIGAAGPAADVEAIAVAGEALAAIGVPELSVDITLPTLVPAVAEAYGIAGARAAALRAALDHKDAAAVAAVAGEAGGLFGSLLAAAGPAAVTLAVLDRLELPARARAERVRLGTVLDAPLGGGPGTQGDGRPGREPWLRVPHRDQLYAFRGHTRVRSANSAAAAAIRPAIRPNPNRRPGSRCTPTRSCEHCRPPPRLGACCCRSAPIVPSAAVAPIAILALPLLIAIAVAAALGVGAGLSALNVRYRDVRYVVPFASRSGSSPPRSPIRARLSEPCARSRRSTRWSAWSKAFAGRCSDTAALRWDLIGISAAVGARAAGRRPRLLRPGRAQLRRLHLA